jgi:hypothetical protein
MSGEQHFRRHGPMLEIAPGIWVNVATVTAVLPADDGHGMASVEADGRPYSVRPVQSVMVQAIADAMLDWTRERAQSEEEGRLLALDANSVPAREEDHPPVTWDSPDSPWG